MHRRTITSAVLLALLVIPSAVPVAQAAGGTYYVDGKTGNDGNDGTTPSRAFKTIAKAAAKLPAGSAAAGWVVNVKGYTDYVYRERPIPPGWDRRGASGAPVVFQATGYAPGSGATYTKPIVSGADAVSKTAWQSTATANVWRAPWPTKPFGYGQYSGSLRTALFQDRTTWLWEQSTLSALATRAKAGQGGYWWSNGYLYASAIGNKDPGAHTIDVIMRNSFLFMGTQGVSRVEVRGFEVRHSANGIAFIKGVDYAVAADNVLTGNLLMGIATSGGQSGSTPNPATGITIARNRGSYNTLQMAKIDEGTQNATVCDNTASDNGLQGIKVQGPPGGTGYTGTTSGITVCRNVLRDNDYNPTGNAYNNASGLTIANGAQKVTVDSNRIYGNDVGVHITQESSGRAKMDGVALKRNEIHDNRRFGIYFYDGAQGTTAGSGAIRSDYDVIWGNGIGVMVGRASSNKTISQATVFDNDAEGFKVGEAGQTASKATVYDSLVTHNGGYGLWEVTGSSATVKYTGYYANSAGRIKGTPAETSVNTKAPGYLSTTVGNSEFLKISKTSYQYTAGPSKTPIGARW